ncbi:MAG: DUF2752 domain-containing protein [Lachnospiraceae bacterium]|nr:DUF2752 domain-containing protein [Lachnospiraceae bacterium]
MLHLPCLFRAMTGLYCPGCGGTRAVQYLLQGRLLLSLRYHPLVLYALLAVAVEAISFVISPNDLPEFPSAALLSVNDATASPPSAALQTENSFCVIWLKVNVSVH